MPGTQPDGLDEVIRVRNHGPFSAVGLEERIMCIDCVYNCVYNNPMHDILPGIDQRVK